MEQVGSLKDVIAQETQLDVELRNAGYRSIVVKDTVYYHLRKFSFMKAIRSQIQAGRMRRQLHMPFWRVLGHSVFRLRPFVVYGYLFKNRKDQPK